MPLGSHFQTIKLKKYIFYYRPSNFDIEGMKCPPKKHEGSAMFTATFQKAQNFVLFRSSNFVEISPAYDKILIKELQIIF